MCRANIQDFCTKFTILEETQMNNQLCTCVCKFILQLKCPDGYTGYYYLRDGLCRMLKHNVDPCSLTKSIYLFLAKKYKTDWANVERCVRNFIAKWWAATKCGGVFEIRPTNRQMFAKCAELIRIEFCDTLCLQEESYE